MPLFAPYLMLVEDNEDDVELARRALNALGLAAGLVVAWNGSEALDYLFGKGMYAERDTRNQPKMVLMDLNMPQLSGLDTLREIRSDVRTRFLPVVMFSTSSEGRDVRASYASGANSYVRKPVGYNAFEDAVREATHYWLELNQLPRGSE